MEKRRRVGEEKGNDGMREEGREENERRELSRTRGEK